MIRRNPISTEQDQRYWRRLANRRVRKARRIKSLLDGATWLALRLFVVGVLGYALYSAITEVRGSDEFSLRRIELTGARRASPEAIHDRLETYLGHNLLELDLDEVEEIVENDPWVGRCSVRRVLPHTLRVGLHERTPYACAVIGGLVHVVDDTGYVIGAAGAGASDDLPVLTGFDALEGADLAEALRRGVEVLARIRATSETFAGRVSELDLAHDDRITLRTVDTSGRLLLDPSRIERNVLSYLRIQRDIEQRVGPLEYADLRWEDRVSVKPRRVK